MENFLEKISENFEKGIDKQKLLCYNISCKEQVICLSGEIGRTLRS